MTRGEKAAKDAKRREIQKDYLIVDGYNVIFAWDELKKLAKDNIGLARLALMDRLANYRAFRGCELVLVFDGYKVAGNEGTREDYHGIRVAYTKDGETADAFIERLIHDIGKNYNVRVATSDGLIQISALRSGVLRMSARELAAELAAASDEMADILADYGHEKTTLGEGARFI